jgi:kinesin family protein 3/17
MMVRGKITLCDLAGSERVKKTGNVEGERLAEAQHINSSLLELGNVVAALATKSKGGSAGANIHIPFRNSTLTRVLADSLGGNCKTSLLICASPFMRDQGETVQAVQFGASVFLLTSAISSALERDGWVASLPLLFGC